MPHLRRKFRERQGGRKALRRTRYCDAVCLLKCQTAGQGCLTRSCPRYDRHTARRRVSGTPLDLSLASPGCWIARSRSGDDGCECGAFAESTSGQLHGPVIIAMITVRMVQPTVYEIVDMVTMRHLFMSTVWTVYMRAVDFRRAVYGIAGVDRDDMFVNVILVHMVKMAVVKIIHMAVMANRGVPAFQAMLMSVIGMMLLGAGRHDRVLPSSVTCRDHWSLFLSSLVARYGGHHNPVQRLQAVVIAPLDRSTWLSQIQLLLGAYSGEPIAMRLLPDELPLISINWAQARMSPWCGPNHPCRAIEASADYAISALGGFCCRCRLQRNRH
jgi:hypothetical protein